MRNSSRLRTLAFAASLSLTLPAFAALGGDATSVTNDQLQMQATLRSTQKQSYTMHELTLPSGTVREYVTAQGKVFGVAWQGASPPDFQQILGTYFQQFIQAGKAHRRGTGPLVIEQPGLVVYSGGHMRAFFGKAYVPDMLPEGVTADAIK
jgi:hypothetical protein